jgi:hypothetical protein
VQMPTRSSPRLLTRRMRLRQLVRRESREIQRPPPTWDEGTIVDPGDSDPLLITQRSEVQILPRYYETPSQGPIAVSATGP